MTRMTGPDCAVMFNLINTHTLTHTRRMTGPDCAVMCNLINTHTHTHTDQREWHRMTRMTRPDCAVMCNLINTHTHTHTHIHTHTHKEAGGGAQGAQGSSKVCTSRESVSSLSRLIRGFRNKYH